MRVKESGVGVDGCRGGWFWVSLADGDAACGVTPHFPELLSRFEAHARILVDMPIGLPSRHQYPRECDRLARLQLGPERGRSVFNVPCREALELRDLERAKAKSRELVRVAFSVQLWALRPKILEVDRLMRSDPSARARVCETHPELVFWALNGERPVVPPKRSRDGFERRLAILAQYEPRARELVEDALARYPRASVHRHDVVDGLACALAARSGSLRTIPPEPPLDEQGLPMQMCLPNRLPKHATPDPPTRAEAPSRLGPRVGASPSTPSAAPDPHGDVFARDMLLTVDAAIVGIGRARWCAIDEDGATEEAARVTMGARRFDVLPIEPRRGPIREFFRTEEWNDYSRVSRCRLTYVETLPAETPIREVIRGLAEQERRFFFLTLNGTVGGLISIANLNSRPVRMYLFGLLSEFERRLGTLVTARDESGLVAETLNSPKVRGHYARDRKRGIDAAPIEYLGLSDLLIVARRLGLIRELDLATPHRLDFTELRDLRNRIAHPIKTLTTGGGSVASLWDMVSLLEEMIFGLRQLQGAED